MFNAEKALKNRFCTEKSILKVDIVHNYEAGGLQNHFPFLVIRRLIGLFDQLVHEGGLYFDLIDFPIENNTFIYEFQSFFLHIFVGQWRNQVEDFRRLLRPHEQIAHEGRHDETHCLFPEAHFVDARQTHDGDCSEQEQKEREKSIGPYNLDRGIRTLRTVFLAYWSFSFLIGFL